MTDELRSERTQREGVPGCGHTTGVKPLSNEPNASHFRARQRRSARGGEPPNGRVRIRPVCLLSETDQDRNDRLFQVQRSRDCLRCRRLGRSATLRAAARTVHRATSSALLHSPALPTLDPRQHRPARKTEQQNKKQHAMNHTHGDFPRLRSIRQQARCSKFGTKRDESRAISGRSQSGAEAQPRTFNHTQIRRNPFSFNDSPCSETEVRFHLRWRVSSFEHRAEITLLHFRRT